MNEPSEIRSAPVTDLSGKFRSVSAGVFEINGSDISNKNSMRAVLNLIVEVSLSGNNCYKVSNYL